MESQNENIRQMLNEFSRALAEAISGSTQMHAAVRRIRQEGYKLHLVLGCLEEPPAEEPRSEEAKKPAPRARRRPPSFRLSSDDVSFLKSIGIDPTRSIRRRRKPGSVA